MSIYACIRFDITINISFNRIIHQYKSFRKKDHSTKFKFISFHYTNKKYRLGIGRVVSMRIRF